MPKLRGRRPFQANPGDSVGLILNARRLFIAGIFFCVSAVSPAMWREFLDDDKSILGDSTPKLPKEESKAAVRVYISLSVARCGSSKFEAPG